MYFISWLLCYFNSKVASNYITLTIQYVKCYPHHCMDVC